MRIFSPLGVASTSPEGPLDLRRDVRKTEHPSPPESFPRPCASRFSKTICIALDLRGSPFIVIVLERLFDLRNVGPSLQGLATAGREASRLRPAWSPMFYATTETISSSTFRSAFFRARISAHTSDRNSFLARVKPAGFSRPRLKAPYFDYRAERRLLSPAKRERGAAIAAGSDGWFERLRAIIPHRA